MTTEKKVMIDSLFISEIYFKMVVDIMKNEATVVVTIH